MWGMKKIFYQGALAKNIFLGDAFKLEKDGPIFPVFSPCPSWPSVVTERDRKQFQFQASAKWVRSARQARRGTTACPHTIVFLPILLNGSPHSLRACIRYCFRLNCHHSPEKRTPVMRASQLAWYGNGWKRDLQHKTAQLDVQKPKFAHILRTYIDLFLPLSFFPMPFFFCCSGTWSSSDCLCFARHFGGLTSQERDL